MSALPYRGRFAPSPTGELHFGSLVAATASHADARHHEGTWLVRIDDVDQTRARRDADRQIIEALEAFGMRSDERIEYQSARAVRYASGLQQLVDKGLAYRCNCSRKTVAATARLGRDGPVYPGTCRYRGLPADTVGAWRFAVDRAPVTFEDRVYGPLTQDLADEVGDFVVFRIDGFCAYQLAVVLDDADQRITHVVRGADLLWSTPRQIALQRQLGLPTPAYAHVPLVCDALGRKLSKRDAAHPLDLADPLPALRAAWRHLGQTGLPGRLRDTADFWRLAAELWSVDRLGSQALAEKR
jgi:glutamyl-Q tRNA(Asp) synthetase